MDDFKFDEFEETGKTPKKKSKFDFKLIIVIVVSIIAGLSVYFVSNALFGKKETAVTTTPATTLDVEDEMVVSLYEMVTYGIRGVRSDKYIRERTVSIDDFSNYEKFYYALMYAEKDDFKDTSKTDNGKKIYSISSDVIKKYMKSYFGDKITYSTESIIPMTFGFKIDGCNSGTLSYDVDKDGFLITFNSDKENVSSGEILPYYTKLDSASTKSDGSIELVEKIIYVNSSKEGEQYNISIYKDYDKTMLIESKTGITKAMLDSTPINVDDYYDSANTITYIFKKNSGGNYYFYSSEISD